MATVEVYERNGVMVDVDPNTAGDQPEVTQYAYDLVGNLARETKPNGNIVDYVYDDLNRLDVQREYQDVNADGDYDEGTDVLLSEFDYTLQADGKRSGVTETLWFDDDNDSVLEEHVNSVSWTYDDLGRLTDEVFDSYDNGNDQTEHFVYDLVGNRVQQTLDQGNDSTIDETTDYVYDSNDRLISESVDTDGQPGYEKVTSYGYDNTQQTLKEVREGGVLQTKTEYGYDRQGQMATAKVTTYTSGAASSVERTTYEYDANGNRVSALVETDTNADGTYDTAVKTEYLNDLLNPTGYSQVLAETTIDVATEEVQKRVIYTFGHAIISQTTVTYSGGQPQATETLYFGRDGYGNTRYLENATGAILPDEVYAYDSFGVAIGFVESAAITSHLYCGEQRDATGLIYLRARYYQPGSGTFTTLDSYFGSLQDPQSLHKYVYCHGDGVNYNDPRGNDANLISTLAICGITMGLTTTAVAHYGFGMEWLPSIGLGVAVGVGIGIGGFFAPAATGTVAIIGISVGGLGWLGYLAYVHLIAPANAVLPIIGANYMDESLYPKIAKTIETYWNLNERTNAKMKALWSALGGGQGNAGHSLTVLVAPANQYMEGVEIQGLSKNVVISQDAIDDGLIAASLVIFGEYQHTFDGGALSDRNAQPEFAAMKAQIPVHLQSDYVKKLRHGMFQ